MERKRKRRGEEKGEEKGKEKERERKRKRRGEGKERRGEGKERRRGMKRKGGERDFRFVPFPSLVPHYSKKCMNAMFPAEEMAFLTFPVAGL